MTQSTPPSLTVCICTRNRARLLASTLQRLEALRIPEGVRWDVLIIDNGSSDETPAVAETARARLPLRLVRSERPGKAHAQNSVSGQIEADFILWTDDDVLVDPEWLAAYVAAIERWPEASFLGGPVEPWFEGTPPDWLARHWSTIGSVFAVRQFGNDPLEFDADTVPYGANFAIRTSVQQQFPYDVRLGPQPGNEIRGEETELIRRMLAAGHRGWWVPEARVRHFVPRSRQTLAYVRRFFVGLGELYGRELGQSDGPRLFGRPRWLVRRALAAECRYRWGRITASPDVWLGDLAEAATAWGLIKGAP